MGLYAYLPGLDRATGNRYRVNDDRQKHLRLNLGDIDDDLVLRVDRMNDDGHVVDAVRVAVLRRIGLANGDVTALSCDERGGSADRGGVGGALHRPADTVPTSGFN